MRKILFCSIILFALVFIGSPAYSYVIGISPSSRDLCVPPGYIYETYVAPSTNSIEPVNLHISWDLPIIEAVNQIGISAGSDLKVPVKIVVPEGYEEDVYNGVIKICSEKIKNKGDVEALACVGSEFKINISYDCSKTDPNIRLIEEKKEDTLYVSELISCLYNSVISVLVWMLNNVKQMLSISA